MLPRTDITLLNVTFHKFNGFLSLQLELRLELELRLILTNLISFLIGPPPLSPSLSLYIVFHKVVSNDLKTTLN